MITLTYCSECGADLSNGYAHARPCCYEQMRIVQPNNDWRGLRVWPKEGYTKYKGPRVDRAGEPVPSGTVLGCNGMGSAYIKWDNGSVSLLPVNEIETYGQRVHVEL